jgi:hypothetical protein
MWSASHKLDRRRFFKPQSRSTPTRRAGPSRLMRRHSATVSKLQAAQTPLSRSNTWSLRYPASVRKRHSWTHQSEQKVRRPAGVSRLHQRHRTRPPGPRGSSARSARPPRIVRFLLRDQGSSGISNSVKPSGMPRFYSRIDYNGFQSWAPSRKS